MSGRYQDLRAHVISPDLLATMPLPDYRVDADKADRGKLLVIAGSRRLPGAAVLAARAALRTGCGTVRVAAPESVAVPIGVALPELMVLPLPETPAGTIAVEAAETLEHQFEPCDAAVIGPGLDVHEETDEVAWRIFQRAPFPLLVDAQALLAVAKRWREADRAARLAGERVFTPHAAEMRPLAGEEVPEEGRDEAAREALALRWARERAAALVLKGRESLIASPDGALYRNTAGTRGLGTAGSGDTLAGIAGSLLAQGLEPARAATWGVYLHALAGEAVAEDLGEDGLLASDWVDRLPRVLRTLRLRERAHARH
jgi:hydroxyethylthiazole kinase-like uncharacterized protein yjeF